MINVQTATTAELVAFYNANAFQPVNKFADRKTAERRVQALLDAAATVDNDVMAMVGLLPVDKKPSARARRSRLAYTQPQPQADATQEAASDTRSAGIAASWAVPAVAEKRKARTGNIQVHQGTKLIGTYRSVAHAFSSLGLSLKGHIPFRISLKLEGQKPFGVYTFAIA